MDSGISDFPLCAPPCEIELDEEDDTIPWMNFPIVEPFNDDYCSGLLPELGVARNETNLVSMERRSVQQDSVSKVLSSVTELDKLKIGDESSLMQSQYPLPRPGNSEFTHSDSMGSKLPSSSSSRLMNFPYFSRLASLSGVNVRNTALATDAVICSSKPCDMNSGASSSTHNHMEPTLVKSSYQETVSHVKLSMPQQAEALSVKAGNNEKSLDTVPSTIMVCDERIPEPVVATSSLCSGNRFESASNNPAYSLKGKLHQTGDSEGSSDEAEEESVGRSGFKRGRAAEVHNSSERRRRERINKKMRALQQLIPSGNKADKASMLDEAIEYLRTLQLQVQILSMGSGMYMPPMMLPASMQQMHSSLMPQFSPLGIGMNRHNVNFSMPSIQAPCYPVSGPPFSTTSAFPGAVGYSPQFLGHLGQELLMPMPPVPPPLFGSPPVRLPVGNVSAMHGTVGLPLFAPSAGSNEMIQNVNDQAKSSLNDDSDQATVLLNNQYQDDDAAQNPGSTKRRRLACE